MEAHIFPDKVTISTRWTKIYSAVNADPFLEISVLFTLNFKTLEEICYSLSKRIDTQTKFNFDDSVYWKWKSVIKYNN